MGDDYLQALRVVLGNQAKAEREGHALEMNIRTDFASERVMRNIINQMRDAGITTSKRVGLGYGRAQSIQVFEPVTNALARPPIDLCDLLRWEEERLEAQYGHQATTAIIPDSISEGDVPY